MDEMRESGRSQGDIEYVRSYVAQMKQLIAELDSYSKSRAQTFLDISRINAENGEKGYDWYSEIPQDATDELRDFLALTDDLELGYSEATTRMIDYSKTFADVLNNSVSQSLIKMADGVADGSVNIEDFRKEINKLKDGDFYTRRRTAQDILGWYNGTGEFSDGFTSVEEIEEEIKTYSELINLFGDVPDNMRESIVLYFESLAKYAEKAADSATSVSYEFDSFRSKIDLLTKAWKESNNEGIVSADTINSLKKAGEDYTDILELTSEGYVVNKEKLHDLIESLRKSSAEIVSSKDGYSEIVSQMNEYSNVLFVATGDNEKAAESFSKAREKMDDIAEIQNNINNGYEYSYTAIENLISEFPELAGYIEETTGGFKIQSGAINVLIDKYKEFALEAAKAVSEVRKQTLMLSGVSTDNTVSNVGNIMDLFYLDNGRFATSMEDFYSAYDQYFDKESGTASKAQFIDGYLDYVDAILAENRVKAAAEKLKNGTYIVRNGSDDTETKADTLDYWKNAYEERAKDLKYFRDIELVSEEEYYRQISELNEKYFGDSARAMHDPTGDKKYLDEYRSNYADYYKWLKDQADSEWEWKEYNLNREKDAEEGLIELYREWQTELENEKRQMLASGIYSAEDSAIHDIIKQYDTLQGKIESAESEIQKRIADAEKERRDAVIRSLEDEEYVIEYKVDAKIFGADDAIDAYVSMCNEIEDALREAYDNGLDYTDEYVQSLKSKLENAKSSIQSMYSTALDSFSDRLFLNQTILSMDGFTGVSNLDILGETEKYIQSAYDSGYITADQYIKDMTSNLKSQYDAVKEEEDKAQKAAEDAQKAKLDSIKAEKEALQEVIDKLKEVQSNYNTAASAVKNLIDQQMEMVQRTLNASEALQKKIVERIETEIEEMNVLKEEADLRKSNLDTAEAAVEKYIDDRISALKEENEELDRQKEIEQALLDLEDAKNRKSKRIYREGVGFVWEADQKAIDDAQAKYDELVAEDEKQKQIDALEAYKKAWQDAKNSYQDMSDESVAQSMLGEDYRAFVDNLDYDAVKRFGDEYTETQKTINDEIPQQIEALTKLKEAWDDVLDVDDELEEFQYEQSILTQFTNAEMDTRWSIFDEFAEKYKNDTRIYKTWENYKKVWDDATESYERDIERQTAASVLGADWEAQILDQRMLTVMEWKNGYASISEEIKQRQDVEMKNLDNLYDAWSNCFDGITENTVGNLGILNTSMESFSQMVDVIRLKMLDLASLQQGADTITAIQTKIDNAEAAIVKAKSESASASEIESLIAAKDRLIEERKKIEDELAKSAKSNVSNPSISSSVDVTNHIPEGATIQNGWTVKEVGGSNQTFGWMHDNDYLMSAMAKDLIDGTSSGYSSVKNATSNSIEIGDIIIQKSDDAESLARDIVNKLPSAIIQKINGD